jgi:aminomethyltransferase
MTLQLSLGTRVRKSPYFDACLKAGLSAASVYNHMYMPTSYGDPAAEYDRLINGVAMWDVSVERQVAIKGPDAIKLARYLTPRNLDGLCIGHGKYVPMCKHDGSIINDPVLLQVENDEVWLSIADSDIQLWVSAIAGSLGMDVEVFEPDVSPLAIQGPMASAVVSDLFGSWVLDLKYFEFRETNLDGIPLLVSRSGWSKQGGYELYLRDGGRGYDLWEKVFQAGQPYNIGPGTPNYVERIESGLVSYGADTDNKTNPFELGMDRFVDVDQNHDFVGKDALIEIKKLGVKRRFMGFVINGENLTRTNEDRIKVMQNGEDVGYLSACAYSPRMNKNIALGMIKLEAIEQSRSVQIIMDDGLRTADVITLPFTWDNQISSKNAVVA